MISISVKEELKKSEQRKATPKPMPKILVNGMAQEVMGMEPTDDIDEMVESCKIASSKILNIFNPRAEIAGNISNQDEAAIKEKPTGLLHDLNAELKDLELKRNKLSSSIYYQVYGKTTPTSIEISEVLARLNRTYDETNLQQRTFGIRALTTNGQTELLNCRKKIIDKKREVSNSDFKHNLKQHGNIMLIREDGQTRTIKVCAIYEFKDHNSKIWTRVRH